MFTTKDIAKLRDRSGASVRQFFDRLPHSASVTPHGKTRWTRGDSILCITAQELARIIPADTACRAVAVHASQILEAARVDEPLYAIGWPDGDETRVVVTGDRRRAAEVATGRAGAVVADLALIASAADGALDRIRLEA